jgi:ABC-2 type transport system permease protein
VSPLSRALRAYPTLLRVGFADAVAYRVEFLIWILTTNMPLVMLALMRAVAREAPIGGFGATELTAYYLTTLLVRLLTGCWVGYELVMDIRQGTLAMRLLRPMHPLIAYSAENLAGVPLRGLVTLPLLIILLLVVGAKQLTHDPLLICIFVISVALAWVMTFIIQACIGALALHVESSLSISELYFGLFSVFSGYLIPLQLFPKWVQTLTNVLPFRFQLGFPVETLTGHLARAEVFRELAIQVGWVGILLALLGLIWNSGIKRYQAFGG